MLKVSLQDHTGQVNIATTFDDAANQLLGVSTTNLRLLSTEPSSLNDIALELTSRHYLFTLSVKMETFNATQHLKTTIVHSEEVPYMSGSSTLLEEIHALTSCSQPIARRI